MHARHELLLRLAYHAAECSREAGLRHTPHSASRPARQCSAAAATECQAAVATGAVHQREWAQAQWGRVQAAVIAAAGASAAAALAVSTSQANCDAPLQEAADEVSNKHTAKFRIFADKARRCTVEVCRHCPCLHLVKSDSNIGAKAHGCRQSASHAMFACLPSIVGMVSVCSYNEQSWRNARSAQPCSGLQRQPSLIEARWAVAQRTNIMPSSLISRQRTLHERPAPTPCSAHLQGRYVEAEQWWEKAKAEAIQGFGGRTAQLAVIANGLAEVYRLAGGERFERAEALYRESIEIVEREYGASDARYAALSVDME